jgi:hypothetical protein
LTKAAVKKSRTSLTGFITVLLLGGLEGVPAIMLVIAE